MMLVDVNDFDSGSVKSWVSSKTGVRIPTSRMNDRILRKHCLGWKEGRGMELERFLERARNEVGEAAADELKRAVEEVAKHLHAEHTIEGLLE
jgi:hypothetical protein